MSSEKDILEKTLESKNDVFADICNVLLFNGQKIINENDLEDAQTHSFYKADGKVRAQERDVAKYWKNTIFKISMVGIENQTKIDYDMPLRVINYDAAGYRKQIGEKGKRYPVITIVLYFGKGEWTKPKSIFDVIEIPKELKYFVSDYKINVISICKLSENQVSMFKSDFKFIAEYFVSKENKIDYKGSKETIKYVDEFFELMKVLSGDKRIETEYNLSKINGEGGKINNMCELLDRIENRGIAIGKEEGRSEGRNESKEEIILKMIEKNYDDNEIMQITGASEEKIKELKEKEA